MVAEDSAEQAEIRRLREQLLEMRSDQIKEILRLVQSHGETLCSMQVDMAEVKLRTETLSPLTTRMDALEQFRWKALGWGTAMGAVGTLAAVIGWMFPRGH
jgi:transposase